jgi:hypothetical protein
MTALFIVRAEVPEADRAAFDRWYEAEHLRDALRAFGARGARRGWSAIDPSVHLALYEFPDLAAARAATAPERLAPLIAEFDRNFARVTRSRELVEITQAL